MVSALKPTTASLKSEMTNRANPAQSNVATKKRVRKRKAKALVPDKESFSKPTESNVGAKNQETERKAKAPKSIAGPSTTSPQNVTVSVSKSIKKSVKGKKRRRTKKNSQFSKEVEANIQESAVAFEGIEESIVSGAVQALMKDFKGKHHDASDTLTPANTVRLMDDDAKVSLVFNLKVPPKNPRFKPKRIELKHSLYKEHSDICMFVKDPADIVTGVLDKLGYGGVTRVMGLAELKTEFKTHERRRAMASTYDLFLCDARVIPSMPKLLGNFFSKTKKMPLEVDLDRKLPDTIERAVKSTSLHMPAGTCTTVHIGTTCFTAEQLVANVMEAISRVVSAVENGIDNIQSVHIKTTRSKSLPLYVSLPTVVNIAPKKKGN